MVSLASTDATVSCTVTGITTELTAIKWYDSSDQPLTADASYTMDDGGLNGYVQTATLTVINGVATDTTYKCGINGTKYEASINVYSKLILPM